MSEGRSTSDEAPGYPRVRARLRFTRHAPGLPASEHLITVWLGGRRFRVRDESGRSFADIVGDVTAPRGFGVAATSMEDVMDAWRASRHPRNKGATELFGDRQSGVGVVHEAGRDSWTTDATRLAPAAEQLLSNGRETTLEPSGEASYLDRACREYHFTLTGMEDGVPYTSVITWLVSGPYVLVRDVRDARISGLRARTEVIELDEEGFADEVLLP
jgi:hypothetical protein